MAGWDSTSVGWESTVEGFESGATVSNTRRGLFMGTTAWPSTDTVSFTAGRQLEYLMYGVEIPDYLSTPNNTGDAGSLDLTDFTAGIALARSYGVSTIANLMGVPREVNPFAGSADPWSAGQWHWYPLDSAGRTQIADYVALFAAELDGAAGDMIQVFGNELQIPAFNHNGQVASNGLGMGAEQMAVAIAEVILAVRTANPTLPIICGSFANRGDINNPADVNETAGGWLNRMLIAEPRLKTTARPDYWSVHPYTGSLPPSAGWAVVNGESANTGGAGWGIPQIIQFRDVLRYHGVTNPDDDPAQVCVTEYGTFYTSTGFSEQLQLQYLQQYISAFDTFRAEGWMAGPEVHYTCYANPSSPGADAEYSIYEYAAPHNPRPAGVFFDFAAAYDPDDYPNPNPDAPVSTIEPLAVRVELGIPAMSSTNPYTLVVGHASRGVVGGAYLVGERYGWIPIEADVVSVQIDRGRDQATDNAEAGTCQVLVRNDRTDRGTAGDYDFFNWASPHFPRLNPRSRIRVIVDGSELFRGDLTTIDVQDERDNLVTTTFNAVDPLGRLARPIRYRPEAEHNAGERLHRILERARVIDAEFLSDGVATFQEGIRIKAPALDWCNDVAQADGGLFYANPSGVYVYLDRGFLRDSEPVVTFSDDPDDDIQYSAIVRSNGWDTLYNSVQITGLEDDSEPESATDSASVQLYGLREYELTLPISSAFGRGFRAQQLLAQYKNPLPHFHTVTVPTTRYRLSERRAHLLSVDIGTSVTVKRTPPGDVLPAEYTQNLVVVGVSHTIEGLRNASVTFTLAPKPV